MAKSKSMRPNKAKVNIPISMAGVLLCLAMLSIHLAGGIFARYTTTADSGDSARVIEFGQLTLSQIGGKTQYIAPGVTLEWNATVTFTGSESATYVFLEVEGAAAGNANSVTPFSKGPAWTVAEGWEYLNDGAIHVYYRSLAPNQTLTNAALFTSDTATVDETLKAKDISDMSSVFPGFRTSVVQSNGFETPADAWASLEDNHP